MAVVADAPEVSERLWDMLEKMAVGGKGLVVFTGERAAAADYDGFLEAYFGMKLGDLSTTPAEAARRLAILSYDHPMLAAFAGGRNGNLAAARLYKWRRLAPSGTGAAAGQLARVDDSEPVILAAAVGAGRAVEVAFAPTNDQTDLQLRSPFVPLMHEMVRYAAGVRGEFTTRAASYDAGQAITFPVDVSAQARTVEVRTPIDRDGVRVDVAPGASTFAYRAFFPGNYTVRTPGPEGAVTTGFSVNVPESESAGERVADTAITAALPGSLVTTDLGERPLERVWGRTRGARELFDIFLVATILVLGLEEFLANRFNAGGRD